MKRMASALAFFSLLACRSSAPSQPLASVDAEHLAELATTPAAASEHPPPSSVVPSKAVQLEAAQISKCLALTPHTVENPGAHIKVELDMKALSSTGNCGCTSALLQFTALEDVGGEGNHRRIEHAHGTFDSRKTKVMLDLGDRASYGTTLPIVVRVGCAAGP